MLIGPNTMVTSKRLLSIWKNVMASPDKQWNGFKVCPSCKGSGRSKQDGDACPRCQSWGFMKGTSGGSVNL
jgi:hypothetical protein